MVSRGTLVCIAVLCTALSVTAVAGDAVESYDLLVQSVDDVSGTRKLLTCQQQSKGTPLVVLDPATNVNAQGNGGDGINQNNQNANTGDQGDVSQGNGNEGVNIGGRKLLTCQEQPKPKVKPVLVVKPATNVNGQFNGGNGINQNNQNANTGDQGDVAQGNSNEGVNIGGRKLLTCQQQPKAKPILVVKPATNVNAQGNGGNGINQNNQNANTGNQGDVAQGNSNDGINIGGRKLQDCAQQPKAKEGLVVLKPATNVNAQGNGGNGINQNNQNANTGDQGDVAQSNSNEGVAIGVKLAP